MSARKSEAVRKLWRDPEFRKRASKKRWSATSRLRASERMREKWRDPGYRERQKHSRDQKYRSARERRIAAIRKRNQDPEVRARRSEATRKQWRDPKFCEDQSERMREQWQDQEYRERMSRPEHLARIGAAMKTAMQERWTFDPKYRERMTRINRQISRRVSLGVVVLKKNGVKGNRSNDAFARRAYAIGKLIDEGGIEKIMRAMFYPPETKSMDTTEK